MGQTENMRCVNRVNKISTVKMNLRNLTYILQL